MNFSNLKNEEEFNKFLVSEYLKFGSVDEAIKRYNNEIPISYAQYHRVLDQWGIVKAAASKSRITETLNFMSKLADEKIPLERLYNRMPSNFRTSYATLYRILSYIKEGITRRIATGLIITPENDENKILIGRDISTPREELGKPYGSMTMPMSFSKKTDPRESAILRVLQQEVFTDLAIDKKIPNIIPVRPKPFMFLDVADVRVEVFYLPLPRIFADVKNFSSHKLNKLRLVDLNYALKYTKKYRTGVLEAIQGYKKYLELKNKNVIFNPLHYKSQLNYFLSEY